MSSVEIVIFRGHADVFFSPLETTLPYELLTDARIFVGQETSDHAVLEYDFLIKGVSDSIGIAAESLATFLRSHGYQVIVRAAHGCAVKHPGCERVYPSNEWFMREAQRQPDVIDGRASFIETRECGCGSTISFGSLRVV